MKGFQWQQASFLQSGRVNAVSVGSVALRAPFCMTLAVLQLFSCVFGGSGYFQLLLTMFQRECFYLQVLLEAPKKMQMVPVDGEHSPVL